MPTFQTFFNTTQKTKLVSLIISMYIEKEKKWITFENQMPHRITDKSVWYFNNDMWSMSYQPKLASLKSICIKRPDQYKMKILVFSIQYDFQILKYQYSI